MAGEKPVLDGKYKADAGSDPDGGDTPVFFRPRGEDARRGESSQISCLAEIGPNRTCPAPRPSRPHAMARDERPRGATAIHRPPGWTGSRRMEIVPASTMRLASFVVRRCQRTIRGPLGRRARSQCRRTPGNVNRWRGRMALSPLDDAGLPGISKVIPSAGDEAVIVDLAGEARRRQTDAGGRGVSSRVAPWLTGAPPSPPKGGLPRLREVGEIP